LVESAHERHLFAEGFFLEVDQTDFWVLQFHCRYCLDCPILKTSVYFPVLFMTDAQDVSLGPHIDVSEFLCFSSLFGCIGFEVDNYQVAVLVSN
jgi:hypothetical protein